MASSTQTARTQLALRRAREALSGETPPTSVELIRRRVVVGDPQASAEKFFSILERAGLLSDSGWLASGVVLTSIGDHFDYGSFDERFEAGAAGLHILSWLAAHPADRVTLIAGNHDLARVADLFHLDDATFERASRRARAIYDARPHDHREERAFLDEHPMFSSVEMAARDLSTFRVEQRQLVQRLLDVSRFRLASSQNGVLLVHAGVTSRDLERARLPRERWSQPDAVAERLNAVFDDAVASWDRAGPFEVPGFFRAGSAADGEPGGFLFHRPARLASEPGADAGRRFDPRSLPLGLTQVVGHVRDPKCRLLLGEWVLDEPGPEGPLRHLETDGDWVGYARGIPGDPLPAGRARMLFVDGGMHHVPVDDYELLEL